jgi:hypothetical protein
MKRKPPVGNSRRVQYIDGNSRYVITNKAGKTVQCESFQERKLALLLERDHTVVDYTSQPDPFHYTTADCYQNVTITSLESQADRDNMGFSSATYGDKICKNGNICSSVATLKKTSGVLVL